MSFGYILSKVGGILSPFIMEILMKFLTWSQIDFFFAVLSLSCCFVCHILPKETLGESLDQVDEKEEKQIEIS